MTEFASRYLAGLRWTEMAMAAALAFLAAVQYETQQGKAFTAALPAAITAAVSAMLLYFRVPKEAGIEQVADRGGAALEPALSRVEAALARAAAPVDISSGSGQVVAPLHAPGIRLGDLARDVALPGVPSHEERVGDRTVYVMDTQPAPAPSPPARSEIDDIAAAVAARLRGQ